MGGSEVRAQRLLPAHPDNVGEARRLLRTSLEKAADPELIETVELVVSEVVTNAVLHAGTEVDLGRVSPGHEPGIVASMADCRDLTDLNGR